MEQIWSRNPENVEWLKKVDGLVRTGISGFQCQCLERNEGVWGRSFKQSSRGFLTSRGCPGLQSLWKVSRLSSISQRERDTFIVLNLA
jgi:hypothetical protein